MELHSTGAGYHFLMSHLTCYLLRFNYSFKILQFGETRLSFALL